MLTNSPLTEPMDEDPNIHMQTPIPASLPVLLPAPQAAPMPAPLPALIPAPLPALQAALLAQTIVQRASDRLLAIGSQLAISNENIKNAFELAKLANDSFKSQSHYMPFAIPATYATFSNLLCLDDDLNSYTVVSDFLFFIITKLYHRHSLQIFHLISNRPTKSLKKLFTSKFLSPPYV